MAPRAPGHGSGAMFARFVAESDSSDWSLWLLLMSLSCEKVEVRENAAVVDIEEYRKTTFFSPRSTTGTYFLPRSNTVQVGEANTTSVDKFIWFPRIVCPALLQSPAE